MAPFFLQQLLALAVCSLNCVRCSVVYELQVAGPPDDQTCVILYTACFPWKRNPSPPVPQDARDLLNQGSSPDLLQPSLNADLRYVKSSPYIAQNPDTAPYQDTALSTFTALSPDIASIPGTSPRPDTPTSPDIASIPGTSPRPDTPTSPDIASLPGTSPRPDTPTSPDIASLPGSSPRPDTPTSPDIASLPGTSPRPDTPTSPDIASIPGTSPRPDTPTSPDTTGSCVGNDHQEAMKEYTICVAFSLSSFTDKATVFSYALSDIVTSMLVLAITPVKIYVTYNYKTVKVAMENLYALERWRWVCMVGTEGHNHTFYVDGVAFKSWPWAEKSNLLPGGALVLGQEQDLLMGSFNSAQAFRGHITELNAWSRALTSMEIQQQGLCDGTFTPGDWVRWDTEDWQPSGRYRRHTDGPCSQKNYSLIFINVKLTRSDAFRTLRIMGMSPYLPHNLEDVENLNRKLSVHGKDCDNDADTGNTVWINAKFNFSSNSWHDGETGEKLHFELKRRKRTYESSDGAVQSINYIWITDDNESENCFAGLVPEKVPLFHLRGLGRAKHPRSFAYSFVLSQISSRCSVYFKGLLLYKIISDSDGHWRLYDSGKNQTLAFCESKGLPIGRLPWVIHSRNRELEPEIQNLTLSICATSEFTCDDGSCIRMEDRCDLVNTCGDWSDERGCEVAITPPGYITSFPPSLSLTMTILVTLEVISVNMREMTIVLDLSVQLRWYDSNVKYRNLRPGAGTNIVGTGGRHSPLWEPSVEVTPTYGFANQRSSFMMVTRETDGSYQGDDVVFDGSENSLQKSVQLQPVVRCNLDLQLFPWDTQTCSFNINIANTNAKYIIFSGASKAEYIGNLVMEEYIIDNVSMTVEELYNTNVVTLVLQRRSEQYVWGTYLPTFLLLAIGYGTLFLPVEPFADRGTMSLTSLLVLVALYTDSLADLPGTSYNTQTDIWYIFTMVYLALIIGVHLSTSGSRSRPPLNLRHTSWLSPLHTPASVLSKDTLILKETMRAAAVLWYSRILFAFTFLAFVFIYGWSIKYM